MSRIHVLLGLVLFSPCAAAQLGVVSVSPPLNANHRAPNEAVVVDFDRPLAPASMAHLRVYGSVSGPVEGARTLENGDTRLRFVPERAFLANEIVTTTMDEQLQAADGSFLRTQGYVASFRVATAPAPRQFNFHSSWSVSPAVFARIYGGQTCDLNDDDFSDLAVICENASDVRVYLSNHDATGAFGPMFGPPNSAGNTPSPNENADMNGDGRIDLVTCDNVGGTASVLLGNGDGSFQPSVQYLFTVSGTHGMAVLDCDGDGDTDVALAGNDQVILRRNNGDGTLAAATAINTAVNNDYGLTAADMNNDGIVDLVVGGTTGTVMVLLSNGDGSFAAQPAVASGGHCWMIVAADVDGDRNMDISIANGSAQRGSVLKGNGNGTLQAPFSTPPVGFMTATDFGDLDGDGDIDWVLSSFGGGVWQVWRNTGAGAFVFDQTINATSNPACCSLLDIDGDRDLDLALFDEIADTVTIRENGTLDAPIFCEGSAAACPCGNGGLSGHGCENSRGTGGGLLLAQGLPSVANDSLVLNVGGLPQSAVTLVLQGTGPGSAPIFDGILCLGGTIKRFPALTASNGFASLSAASAGAPLSVIGGVPLPGGVFRYQAWYRDNQPFCTAGAANTSNGITVTWTP
ncbi:MAG: VCBS repeat-containing protein [Planctomycetes bacterium]|nr:VCBS repeat-containing protein [Planctomycetota bacterium]